MCTSTPLDKSLWMGSTSAVVHTEWNHMGARDTMPERQKSHKDSGLGSPTRCLWCNLHSVWVAVVSGWCGDNQNVNLGKQTIWHAVVIPAL